ncbi:nitrilase-related carbon-nitrogen hydrolase [Sulfurimonas sp. HSL-1716]|uniref:nitrilase-related carbon-nitrogen hydrolase n=1 Tax=Hydrocurvibacter sulfurireducens TaxID=3131937 RepID=UPI0031F92D9E
MKITLVQNTPKLNRTNLDRVVEEALACKSEVIVFCELALNGYLLQDKLLEDAFLIDELKPLCDASVHRDIVVGAALKIDDEYFNCALYFSGGELLNVHKKVHLPNYGMFEEARYFDCGKEFESFKTSYGEAALLVCEDLWNPDTVKELFAKKPKIVYVLAASPARGFKDDSLTIQEQWYDLLTNLTLHCGTKVVFVNRVGFEDGLGFWGGSCIMDSDAKILHKLPLFDEKIETVEVKI